MKRAEKKTIALVGNPNVGKSTIFNALTGLRQHTGNWPGKTVDSASGSYHYGGCIFTLIDIPGTYSLSPRSGDEKVACDLIMSKDADLILVVIDSTCLERNLNLIFQVLATTQKAVVCVNLIDEAKRKNIEIDLDLLSVELGVPVVGTAASKNVGLDELKKAIYENTHAHINADADGKVVKNTVIRHEDTGDPTARSGGGNRSDTEDVSLTHCWNRAEKITKKVLASPCVSPNTCDAKLDRLLTSRFFAVPSMLILLAVVFWITLQGANIISETLSFLLFGLQDKLIDLFAWLKAPVWLSDMIIMGVYRTVAWVVSVMLPPMAIFFPLFTLLEDLGYLPRIAFNLDNAFKRCSACGKQALTMCQGFGCNAVGIIGCRIIDSPRERLIAIITNCFVPCNGRFPALIAVIVMFFCGMSSSACKGLISALSLTAVIVLGIIMTFLVSKLLSVTILKGLPSAFIMELPPYRKPQVLKVITRSVFDRTIFVLGRAVMAAAPAGLLIWVMANIQVGVSGHTLLSYIAELLDPLAGIIGLDGYILLAFILGFPANEIVIPVLIMGYLCAGSLMEFSSLYELKDLLILNGWTWITAVNFILFNLMHWPCATSLITIRRETGSLKWTLVSFLVPAVAGFTTCFLFTTAVNLFIAA